MLTIQPKFVYTKIGNTKNKNQQNTQILNVSRPYNTTFGKLLMDRETFDLLKEVVNVGKKFEKAFVDSRFDLKPGIIVECDKKKNIYLMGTAHNNRAPYLIRENKQYRVSAKLDFTQGERKFKIEDKASKTTYEYQCIGFSSHDIANQFSIERKNPSKDEYPLLFCSETSNPELLPKCLEMSKKGLRFILGE